MLSTPFDEGIWSVMSVTVKNVSIFLTCCSIGFDSCENICFDFLLWYFTLKWVIFGTQSLLHLLCNLMHIDDLASCGLCNSLSYCSLARKRSTSNESPFNLEAQVFLKCEIVPVSHFLKSELLLENRINVQTIQVTRFKRCSLFGCLNNSSNMCAVLLELLSLFNILWEM